MRTVTNFAMQQSQKHAHFWPFCDLMRLLQAVARTVKSSHVFVAVNCLQWGKFRKRQLLCAGVLHKNGGWY